RRAAVAVGDTILVICWHLLTTGEIYTDLGADYFNKHHATANRPRRLVAQLEAMGNKVTLEPAA
ncbi:MAG: IS110 family transposase, partial [Actinobacteria bacterium]